MDNKIRKVFLFFTLIISLGFVGYAATMSVPVRIHMPPQYNVSSCNGLINDRIGEPFVTYSCLIDIETSYEDNFLEMCHIEVKDNKNEFVYKSRNLLQLKKETILDFKDSNAPVSISFDEIKLKYDKLGTYELNYYLNCSFWDAPPKFHTKTIDIIDSSPFKQITIMFQQLEFAKSAIELQRETLDELKFQRNETNQQFKESLDYIIEQNRIAKWALIIAIIAIILEIIVIIIEIFKEEIKRNFYRIARKRK